MHSASHGLRGLGLKPGIGHGFNPPATNTRTQRSIHTSTPSFLSHPPIPKTPNVGTTQRLLSQTRNILSRFVAHLTAPGLGTVPSTIGRAAHTHAPFGSVGSYSAKKSIQQGFSFPTRVALSRPLQTSYLPRAPVTPRSVTQVGLGTARNFSTGRPIFQHLVENVPIVGRTFYEADWEIKLQEERQMMIAKYKKEKKMQKKIKQMQKSNVADIILRDTTNYVVSNDSVEFDQYFCDPSVAPVTTVLLVPLAPTPTSRHPLSATDASDQPRLPLRVLGQMHASYSLHSIKVSSLFSRLDAANVWNRNVKCSAYSHGSAIRIPEGPTGDVDGTCTVLKLEFIGWTKAEVRGVIGESGSGWCVLEEVSHKGPADSLDSILSPPGRSDDFPAFEENESSRSFVMPTLDFSSTHESAVDQSLQSSPHWGSEATLSPSSLPSIELDADRWSDDDSLVASLSPRSLSDMTHLSDDSDIVFVDPPSTNGYFGFGFSSDFLRRRADTLRDESEAWEDMF